MSMHELAVLGIAAAIGAGALYVHTRDEPPLKHGLQRPKGDVQCNWSFDLEQELAQEGLKDFWRGMLRDGMVSIYRDGNGRWALVLVNDSPRVACVAFRGVGNGYIPPATEFKP